MRGTLDYSLGILTYLATKDFKFNYKIKLIRVILIILIFTLYANFEYNKNLEYLAPFFFCILIAFYRHEYCKSELKIKISTFLGNISYPTYLIHPLLIAGFSFLNINPSFISTILYLLLCIGSALIIHSYIEKPMPRYKIKPK